MNHTARKDVFKQTTPPDEVVPGRETIMLHPSGDEATVLTSSATSHACAECGQPNPAQRKFCASCGQALWEPCLNCRHSNGAWEKYCGECGVEVNLLVKERIDQIALARQQAATFRDLYRHREAVQLLAALKPVEHSRVAAQLEQARQLLVDIHTDLDRIESEREQRYEQAQASFANHDFADAASQLEQVNWRLRRPEMQALLSEARARLEEMPALLAEIRQAVAAKQTGGLLARVERFLELDPRHTQVCALHEKLVEIERRQQAKQAIGVYQRARQRLAARDYAKAVELLSDVPESARTPEIEQLAEHCRIRAEEVAWLARDLASVIVWDEHVVPLCDRLIKLRPDDASARKLGDRLRQRGERSAAERSVTGTANPPMSLFGWPVGLLAGLRRINDEAIRHCPAYRDNAGALFTATGLALQALGRGPISVNLLPGRKSLLSLANSLLKRRSATAWGIDVGISALKAVRLAIDQEENRVRALECELIEYDQPLSHSDASPETLVRQALETFLQRHKLEEDGIAVGYPGPKTLARFIPLPPADKKKLSAAVTLEARRQIPFDLASVIWDWQVTSADDQRQGESCDHEVGVFAVKADETEQFLFPFQELKIKIDLLQSDALALYNYLAFDYFMHVHGALRDKSNAAEVTAVLDIGANSSNLVIGNGASVWMRNLPLGSNHFNKPLISQLQLTWLQAEELKRDPLRAQWVSQMYLALEPALRDLAGELQRSIGYFQHTYKKRAIQQLLVVGNGAKLHGLLKHFCTPT